ncbi:hypothetical protein ACFSTD_06095 [Novosphingobium colocasiae]
MAMVSVGAPAHDVLANATLGMASAVPTTAPATTMDLVSNM